MRNAFGVIGVTMLAGLISVVKGDPIIFDRGPDATTANSAAENLTSLQNLAGMFELTEPEVLTGYDLFAAHLEDSSETFHFKLLADAGGKPGTLLTTQDLLPTSVVLILNGGNQSYSMYDYSFSLSSVTLSADTTYWVGVSGNGNDEDEDPGQWTTSGTPDSRLAIFNGTTFEELDNPALGQMFQLEGHPLPEPAMALAGFTFLALAASSSRQRRTA